MSKTIKDIAQEQRTMGLCELQGVRDLYQTEIDKRVRPRRQSSLPT